MARKNMFDGIAPATRPETDAAPAPARAAPEIFQSAGPIAAIRNDLRSMASRSVHEIAPELIEDIGLKDRLGDLAEDVAELRESIRKHGQQVPILLRPHPHLSGHYQVVYGRRRLAAIRGLDMPVKALVRTLSDEEAVLAQGQENSLRKDPSFIEKALFAGDLEEAGYESRVIQDALNVNRSHISHMRRVRESFPRALIERIGAAPSVGWKRWYGLAARITEEGIDPLSVHPAPFAAGLDSDQRFEAWAAAWPKTKGGGAVQSETAAGTGIMAADGSEIGTLRPLKSGFSFQSSPQNRAFADWMNRNAAALFRQLHDTFLTAEPPETAAGKPQPQQRSKAGKG